MKLDSMLIKLTRGIAYNDKGDTNIIRRRKKLIFFERALTEAKKLLTINIDEQEE